MNGIEDEIHFLFRCSKYSTIRNTFYNKIANRISLQLTDLIFDLINCNDNIINMQLVKFVSSSFDLRNKLLSSL